MPRRGKGDTANVQEGKTPANNRSRKESRFLLFPRENLNISKAAVMHESKCDPKQRLKRCLRRFRSLRDLRDESVLASKNRVKTHVAIIIISQDCLNLLKT